MAWDIRFVVSWSKLQDHSLQNTKTYWRRSSGRRQFAPLLKELLYFWCSLAGFLEVFSLVWQRCRHFLSVDYEVKLSSLLYSICFATFFDSLKILCHSTMNFCNCILTMLCTDAAAENKYVEFEDRAKKIYQKACGNVNVFLTEDWWTIFLLRIGKTNIRWLGFCDTCEQSVRLDEVWWFTSKMLFICRFSLSR